MNIQNRIGARIRKLREERNLKQRELAEYLDITPAGYGKLEAGVNDLSSKNCIALAEYYGVTCDYILRGIEAEYVDVCTKTGLNVETLEILEKKEAELKQIRKNITFYTEQLDAISNDIKYSGVELEKHPRHDEYVDYYCYKAENEINMATHASYKFIVNSMIANQDFLDSVTLRAKDAVQNAIYLYHTISCKSQKRIFELTKIKDFENGLNSSKYIASMDFSNFFNSIWKNIDFIHIADEIGFASGSEFCTKAFKEWLKEH